MININKSKTEIQDKLISFSQSLYRKIYQFKNRNEYSNFIRNLNLSPFAIQVLSKDLIHSYRGNYIYTNDRSENNAIRFLKQYGDFFNLKSISDIDFQDLGINKKIALEIIKSNNIETRIRSLNDVKNEIKKYVISQNIKAPLNLKNISKDKILQYFSNRKDLINFINIQKINLIQFKSWEEFISHLITEEYYIKLNIGGLISFYLIF